MDRIGVRELRQHASRYLSRVESGETIEITDRGRLVAVLSPPTPSRTARDRLIAEGQILPAAAPGQFPPPVQLTGGGKTTDDILAELREDRT